MKVNATNEQERIKELNKIYKQLPAAEQVRYLRQMSKDQLSLKGKKVAASIRKPRKPISTAEIVAEVRKIRKVRASRQNNSELF